MTEKIRIINLEAKIDNEPTHVDESSSAVLKYRTPNFRATASIEMAPLEEGEKWKVGWIQACTDMMFHNTYGEDGFTSWEFPELTSGKQIMISDCDGRHYPWYGSRNETAIFEGFSDVCQTATITMNDNFHPHVTWRNPANRNQSSPNLTHIIRDQSFYVWLVVWNMSSMKSFILQTIQWRMELEIEVDPSKSLGHRAKLISNPVPRQPILLDKNVPIPRCALVPPNANSAQMLVWRAASSRPLCIIPPVWSADEKDKSKKAKSKL
ncbi:hypothetical protein LOTGIDRAFT_113796 [Lottia gigantea]|uniref:Protein FAM78A n=1 Tax=Lottia gigantea TaxID=225164 RepID=V4AUT6_LOTGI|nr:hypothetical protein LOTGIDRAFT_113796 [Lottia gigantea]ESO98725.1 hypothetical protein LOTGIDRAFT_113796 [Lottia gigantea]